MSKQRSVKDILSMDLSEFNKMKTRELRQLTTQLVSAGNKRIARFQKAGESSPALRYIEESGGKFSVAGKNLNQLRKEFMRIKGFYESETGSLRDWHRTERQTVESLSKSGVNITSGQMDVFWRSYEALKEQDPSIAEKNLKYEILSEISDVLGDPDVNTVEDVLSRMQDLITETYEESEFFDDDFSEFFDEF